MTKLDPLNRYEVGYRDGEHNREADAVVYHEEVLDHEPSCRCPLGAFLAHLHVYDAEDAQTGRRD